MKKTIVLTLILIIILTNLTFAIEKVTFYKQKEKKMETIISLLDSDLEYQIKKFNLEKRRFKNLFLEFENVYSSKNKLVIKAKIEKEPFINLKLKNSNSVIEMIKKEAEYSAKNYYLDSLIKTKINNNNFNLFFVFNSDINLKKIKTIEFYLKYKNSEKNKSIEFEITNAYLDLG